MKLAKALAVVAALGLASSAFANEHKKPASKKVKKETKKTEETTVAPAGETAPAAGAPAAGEAPKH